jgi:hypothetical protein
MSNNILNDISKVYFEQIFESAVPGKPAERLGAIVPIPQDEREAARQRTLAKAAAIRAKKMEEALDPVGKEDSDIDNDGKKNTRTDRYLLNRRRVRGKAIAKEGYSNWRDDLSEVIDLIGKRTDTKIVEKKVDNKIIINPNTQVREAVKNLGGELIEMIELDEDLISEEIEIVTEYFYEQGLNGDGIDILVEKLGLEEFINFVYDISENYYLVEWRRGAGGTKVRGAQVSKGGKHISTLKGAAKSSAVRGTAEHKGRKVEREKTDSGSSGMTSALKSQSDKARNLAVKKAVVMQPDKTPDKTPDKKSLRDRIAGHILRGIERHKAATQTAGKALNVAGKAATEFGKGFSSGVNDVRKVGKRVLTGEEYELEEKTLSSAETKKKEEIVRSMKKNLPGFRSRYGERAKEVMYATATKKAKDVAEASTPPTQQAAQTPNPADAAALKTKISAQKNELRARRVQLAAQQQELNKGVSLPT